MSQYEWSSDVNICQVIPILGILLCNVTCKDYTCTIDQDIETTEFLSYSNLDINQVWIVSELTLNCETHRRVLLSNAIKFPQIFSNQCNLGPIVQIPIS